MDAVRLYQQEEAETSALALIAGNRRACQSHATWLAIQQWLSARKTWEASKPWEGSTTWKLVNSLLAHSEDGQWSKAGASSWHVRVVPHGSRACASNLHVYIPAGRLRDVFSFLPREHPVKSPLSVLRAGCPRTPATCNSTVALS